MALGKFLEVRDGDGFDHRDGLTGKEELILAIFQESLGDEV
jgi:hypothetical protein